MLNRGLDKLELLRIVEAVANEKSIDKELVIGSMESAIEKAALTKFVHNNNILVKIISFLSLLLISCNFDSSNYKRIQGDAFGTTYQVIVQSESNSSKIKQSIDSIFEVVNNSMSTYRSNSIISKVNQSQNPVKVDSHFIEVFKKSKDIWKLSNGYFDPTAGSIVNLYGMGPNNKIQSINEYKIDSVMQYVGLDKVYLNQQNFIVKTDENVYIDFNAIAKGYSVDLIKDLLININSNNFLIEVG